MNATDLKFTTKDLIKAVGFVGFVGSMWFDLKSEQINSRKEREFIQYQVTELKSAISYRQAIKPEEPKLKNYTH